MFLSGNRHHHDGCGFFVEKRPVAHSARIGSAALNSAFAHGAAVLVTFLMDVVTGKTA
jgi:hypothetical protein